MGEDYNLRLTQARFSFYSLTSPYSAISFSKQFLSMETSVFLSPSEQDAILLGQRIVFGISSILNILSLICLLRETPPHQATVRNYLVLIQCFLVAADVYLNILFEPIPLFPLAAAFCKGLLCDRGIHMAYLTNIIFWLLLMVLCSTILCCIFRHQTLLPPKHRAKLADVLVVTPLFLLSLFVHMFRLLHSLNRTNGSIRYDSGSVLATFVQHYEQITVV
ncbi:hypothetical protein PRIPAC_82873, partial [Pristionchus pacificus]|uniref:G protein-coupled receptor n=1 Tax=Pristionchus pacificus TaxID=54126 RepID=A0A2A6CMV8_PRIPA|eukprot:PDM79361.1 G protein-coupled receptor [Pristionchus pacificus]